MHCPQIGIQRLGFTVGNSPSNACNTPERAGSGVQDQKIALHMLGFSSAPDYLRQPPRLSALQAASEVWQLLERACHQLSQA